MLASINVSEIEGKMGRLTRRFPSGHNDILVVHDEMIQYMSPIHAATPFCERRVLTCLYVTTGEKLVLGSFSAVEVQIYPEDMQDQVRAMWELRYGT